MGGKDGSARSGAITRGGSAIVGSIGDRFCADVPLLAAPEATDWPVGRFTLDAGASAVYP
ncbi:MAG TPA: hypothetical protein DCX42_01980 [Planktomarina temperata]|nr:hypothetical protein [Planktomarina temperata]